jgi:LCP family protein required for cell wall assembly
MNLKLKQDQHSYPKLDLIRQKEGLTQSKKTKKASRVLKIFLGIFIFGALLGLFFSYRVLSVGKDIFQSKEGGSILTQLKHLVLSDNRKIIGENEGRTNILLLGMGGEGHQGAFLTDTIMVVSIKYNEGDKPGVALISIPRDLAVPFNGSNYVKINSVYAYGEMRKSDDKMFSGKLISQTINYVTGLPIHYYVRVDFEGFKQIIDSLGGVDVDVKNSFYDPMYPTENFGYQKISFKKGMTHMDGDLALKYARSRHGIVLEGEGNEGLDFARAERQQQILSTIKDKAFSISTIINLKKINDVLGAMGDHIRTSLEPWEILRLAELAKNVDNETIINRVIDNQESGLLVSTTAKSGAYLLMPRDKAFDEIKNLCQNIFDSKQIQNEKAKIAVLNGTEIADLAKSTAEKLSNQDYEIIFVGNAKDTDYEKTVIYDLSEGKTPLTLKALTENFHANVSQSNNSSLKTLTSDGTGTNEKIDFIIILGLDSGDVTI